MSPLYPSLIAADLLNLKEEITLLDPHVPGYHIDVMDFHFVPNMAMSPDLVNALRKATNKPFLVHLMVEYPERYFDRIHLRKGDIVSLHPEAPSKFSPKDLLEIIRQKGWTPSIALNPETSVSIIKELEPEHVLLMAVNPGFSGQRFMPLVYDKLKELKGYTVAIDGGVDKDNARKLIEAGADQLVVGSALFKDGDPLKTLQTIKDVLTN